MITDDIFENGLFTMTLNGINTNQDVAINLEDKPLTSNTGNQEDKVKIAGNLNLKNKRKMTLEVTLTGTTPLCLAT